LEGRIQKEKRKDTQSLLTCQEAVAVKGIFLARNPERVRREGKLKKGFVGSRCPEWTTKPPPEGEGKGFAFGEWEVEGERGTTEASTY